MDERRTHNPAHTTRWRRWRFAAKPASWNKLLVPTVFGHAIGLAAGRGLSWAALGAGLAFTALDLCFIVFLNDWADRDVDAIKRRMFPSGSEKTIPDGILPAHQLLAAGALAGVSALAVAFASGAWLGRLWFGPLAVLSLAVFAAYTLPPLRLNYRGGGELLEMFGVGVLLPTLHAYLQAGALDLSPLWLLPGFALLALASAVASGLSDERSDRRGGKTTFVSVFGNLPARRFVEVLTGLGAAAWALAGVRLGWPGFAAAAVVAVEGARLLRLSPAAVTDAFLAQRKYKARMHHAMWRGALCASMLLAWQELT